MLPAYEHTILTGDSCKNFIGRVPALTNVESYLEIKTILSRVKIGPEAWATNSEIKLFQG